MSLTSLEIALLTLLVIEISALGSEHRLPNSEVSIKRKKEKEKKKEKKEEEEEERNKDC